MPDQEIKISPNANLAALRNKLATDPNFARAVAKDPAGELAKVGVQVDPATAKSISDHLGLMPQGTHPALVVSVVVSAII